MARKLNWNKIFYFILFFIITGHPNAEWTCRGGNRLPRDPECGRPIWKRWIRSEPSSKCLCRRWPPIRSGWNRPSDCRSIDSGYPDGRWPGSFLIRSPPWSCTIRHPSQIQRNLKRKKEKVKKENTREWEIQNGNRVSHWISFRPQHWSIESGNSAIEKKITPLTISRKSSVVFSRCSNHAIMWRHRYKSQKKRR